VQLEIRKALTLLVCAIALATTPRLVHTQQSRPQAPPPPSAIVGRITDESGRPVVWARIEAFRRLKRWNGPFYEVSTAAHDDSDDRGLFRLHSLSPGRYFVSVQVQRASAQQPETIGYLRTYFPGTSSLGDAQPVTVAPGEEQSISIRLVPVRFTTVAGIVTTSDGRPAANFEATLRSRSADWGNRGVDGGFMTPITAQTRSASDGSFSLSRVPPGAYTLAVTSASIRQKQPFEIAEVPVDVASGVPVADLKIVTQLGATVSGQLEWGGMGPVPWPRDTKTLGHLRAAGIGRQSDYGGLDTDVKPDGTFQFTNLYGLRRIESMGLVFDWVIKSVDAPEGIMAGPNLDIKPGTVVNDVKVIVTDRKGTLIAAVSDEEDKPFLTGWVLLLPKSPTELDAHSWGLRATQKNRSFGGIWYYSMEGIIPGSYLAAAIDVEPSRLTGDTELMERARAAALSIEVHEGENRLPLRVLRLRSYVQAPDEMR
jgi:hypothetical protein